MSTCRFTSTTTPRVLGGRHDEACRNDECPGCAPCPEVHCRVDGRTHVDRHPDACAECRGEARENLHEIARLCGSLPEEVEHRGVEGEAMMLLGPVSDPEAWGHVTASVAAGRLSREWVEEGGGELHPLTVLLSWQMTWRDALEHDEARDSELAAAVAYLDQTLTYMATFEWVPFEDFARDLRRCVGHLEAVLHDGEQRDTGAPCLNCRVPLVREWGRLAASDGWRCPKCREWRSEIDYRLNVAQLHNIRAEWLTDRDMETRTGVKAGTVRSWARHNLVDKRQDSGRVLYLVADVQGVARDKNMLKGA